MFEVNEDSRMTNEEKLLYNIYELLNSIKQEVCVNKSITSSLDKAIMTTNIKKTEQILNTKKKE